MSFESGRKLGLTASLISVIVPVVIVVFYGLLFFSLFGAQTTTFISPLLSFGAIGIWIALIAVGFISLIGFIMFIVSMYQLSHYYNEPGIFKNILYALVVGIVGVVTLVAIMFAAILSTIRAFTVSTPLAASPATGLFFVGLLSVIGVAFVIGIVSTFFYKLAFNKLAEKSGVHSFDTAGLLILIGVIIPFVSWFGWIFAASGFHSLKPKLTETSSAYTMPTAPPITIQNKYCPYCGTANTTDSIYCKNCGRKLL
jgi:uncharacterized membrane protein